MALHGEHQTIGQALNDSDGLRFGNDCDFVHRAGDEIAEIAEFRLPFSASRPAEEFIEQFFHAHRRAIHVARDAVDLGLGKSGTDQ